VIVAGVIALHDMSGLILATLMAGFILIAAGYAGVGRLMRFVPMPVVTGFTAGIAVIIASSQVGDFLGLDARDVPVEFVEKWIVYVEAMGRLNVAALGVGLGTLLTIIAVRRFARRLPAYLLAILAATLAAALLNLPVETVGDRFPSMPTGLPMPQLPSFSYEMARDVLPSAFTIAFLAGIEALLSAVVADGMTGYRHRSGQELVGMGVANIASAGFGGLPATGAIARTATNVRAGGQTPVAGMLHAIFLLLFMMLAGDLIAYVPMATLSAVLLMVAWGMSEADRFKALLRTDPGERALLLLTFGLTVMVDLTVAIGVGVTLAALLFMRRMSEHAGLVAVDPEEAPDQRDRLPPGVEVMRFTGPIFFGVASELIEALRRVGERPRAIVLRMELVPYIDATGANALETFVRQARGSDTEVWLCGMQRRPLDFLARMDPPYAGARRALTYDGTLERLQRSP
ncbi:MAG: SulP family inorganic anion transporter, partial [Allosphingosinicella sp.]